MMMRITDDRIDDVKINILKFLNTIITLFLEASRKITQDLFSVNMSMMVPIDDDDHLMSVFMMLNKDF